MMLELGATGEGTVLAPVVDDVLGEYGTQSADIGKQVLRGGVEVDADEVDATLDGLVEGVLELGLVDVVLILSDTDALGVDLDEFGQGVHESAANRDGPADGDILVGEFVAGHLGGAVDGGAVLADDEDGGGARGGITATHSGPVRGRCQTLGNKVLGFAAGGAVADGNGFDVVVVDHLQHVHGGLHTVVDGRVGEDGLVVEQVALGVLWYEYAKVSS